MQYIIKNHAIYLITIYHFKIQKNYFVSYESIYFNNKFCIKKKKFHIQEKYKVLTLRKKKFVMFHISINKKKS
jgi:hypothetical protein